MAHGRSLQLSRPTPSTSGRPIQSPAVCPALFVPRARETAVFRTLDRRSVTSAILRILGSSQATRSQRWIRGHRSSGRIVDREDNQVRPENRSPPIVKPSRGLPTQHKQKNPNVYSSTQRRARGGFLRVLPPPTLACSQGISLANLSCKPQEDLPSSYGQRHGVQGRHDVRRLLERHHAHPHQDPRRGERRVRHREEAGAGHGRRRQADAARRAAQVEPGQRQERRARLGLRAPLDVVSIPPRRSLVENTKTLLSYKASSM